MRRNLEREVLASLAGGGRSMSPAEVQSDLEQRGIGRLAYTSVMTTLSRLYTKGVVSRERAGRGFAYAFTGSLEDVPNSVRASQMLRILDGGADRAGILARFVSDLGPEDEQTLLQLLADDADADTDADTNADAYAEDADDPC